MIKKCPICTQTIDSKSFYHQKRCPVLNNVLYDTTADALLATTGALNIKQCKKCGFLFNANFTPELLSYQKEYNSSRSNSNIYKQYISSLVNIIKTRINENSTILEIGCGDGSFLKELSDKSNCFCWGYDPSYKGLKNSSRKIQFINECFCTEINTKKFDVIILRHILEHIWEPYTFLKNLVYNALKKNSLIIIEVPDNEWIISNFSFFDFTYEHCNYFNHNSLQYLLNSLAIKTIETRNVFQDQYLLVLGVWTQNNQFNSSHNLSNIQIDIKQQLEKKKKKLIQIVKRAEKVCIWGASGKGVVLLSSFDREITKKIDFVIDIDPLKQNKYMPVSGKKVLHPYALKGINKKITVLIMNNIYRNEIQLILDQMNVRSQLITV